MCAKFRAAHKAAQLGLKIFGTLCRRPSGDGREIICQYYSACPYIKQWKDRSPGVRIFAHVYLPLPRPRPEGHSLPEPDLVIVDENAVSSLIGTCDFSPDRLEGPAFDAVRDALMNKRDLREALLERGVTKQTARQKAIRLIEEIETDVRPDMPEREALGRLDQARCSETHKLAQFWYRVAAEIDLDRPFHGVEVCANEQVKVNGTLERQDRVHVHWAQKPVIGATTPLLMIDANADVEINRVFFDLNLRTHEIHARRNAHVTQCYSTRLSKRTLLGSRPKVSPQETMALRKVKEIIKRERADQGGRILVVMPKLLRMFLTGANSDQTAEHGSPGSEG